MTADAIAPMTDVRPTIGCFGLGSMGRPIATRLVRAGYPVAAADPDARAMASWTASTGTATHTPAGADIVITCVTDEAALEHLVLGRNGLADAAHARQVFIDHTTTSPALARRIAERLAERGASFIDAPVSGAAAGAQAGSLSVFAGGDRHVVDAATRVLAHYAARVTYLGPAGSGQAGKLANQIAIAGTVRGLAEAVTFARGTGLDLVALLAALAAGSARSNQLEQHTAKLADPKFAFARDFDWLAKDLTLALEEGHARSIELAQTKLVGQLLERDRP